MIHLACSLVLAFVLGGCSGFRLGPIAPPCLSGPVPQVGRPVPDEMFALMRRERARAEAAPPLVRARILEGIPELFPDVSDLVAEPRCQAELREESAAAFDDEPLVFSRLLVARLRVTHDAATLMPLATRPESSITVYQPGPDEPGPLPPKSLVRYLALASIPAHWVANNSAGGRRFLLDRLRASRDDRELILLHGAAIALFQGALWGHPARAEGEEGPAMLRGWVQDLARRIQGPADRASLELALVRLAAVGTYGTRFGVHREARALVEAILAAKGGLPLTRGNPGAARDLAEVARGALYDLEVPQRSVSGRGFPPPRRDRFEVGEDWLDREPAGGRVKEVDALSRVRDLDAELDTLHYAAPRCRVLEELGAWLPPGEASRRFDALIAPALEGERIRLSTETICRLRVALGLRGVEEARRVALSLRLLRATPDQIGARDHSLDEKHPAITWLADDEPIRDVAARALASHLDWVDRHPALRAWLEAEALAPIPLRFAPAEVWSILQPAFERVLELHLSGGLEAQPDTGPEAQPDTGPEAQPDTAQAILRAWMDSVRAAEAEKNVGHIYVGAVIRARIRALGEYGRRAGLVEEVGAFLAERRDRREAAVASYLLTL